MRRAHSQLWWKQGEQWAEKFPIYELQNFRKKLNLHPITVCVCVPFVLL